MVLSSTGQSFTKVNRPHSFGFPQGRSVCKGNPSSCLHRSSRTILFATPPPLLPHQVLRCEEIRPNNPFRLRSLMLQKEPIFSATVTKSVPQSYGFLPSSHNSFTVQMQFTNKRLFGHSNVICNTSDIPHLSDFQMNKGRKLTKIFHLGETILLILYSGGF